MYGDQSHLITPPGRALTVATLPLSLCWATRKGLLSDDEGTAPRDAAVSAGGQATYASSIAVRWMEAIA